MGKKFQIIVINENCAGCLRCQLACSDRYAKAFQPAAARIRVIVDGPDAAIEFTDDCTRCGACADNCFYGALQKSEEAP